MDERPETDDDLRGRSLAHDLLQSISIIQALVTATRLSPPPPEQLDATLAMVETETQVMAALCQRHVEGARFAESIDLAVISRRVVQRMQVTYGGQIEADVAEVLVDVIDDPMEWERSLVNLVENACRAAGPVGKVSVRCLVEGDAVHLTVGDSGPGFGAAPAGRSSLGMVTVSRLVDRHGGHLELRRSPLGGAQVTIVVPLPA